MNSMILRCICSLCLPLLSLSLCLAGEEEWESEDPVAVREEGGTGISAFVYVGQYTNTGFLSVARLDTELRSSHIIVVGVTHELARITPSFKLEGEVQFGQHWGRQSHQEINVLNTARWMRFPWNEFLPTTAAFGWGFSYAFERPPLEARPGQPPDQFLVYLLLELSISPAAHPDWDIFARIHHRSDGYGVIGDARASNFLGLGLRRHF